MNYSDWSEDLDKYFEYIIKYNKCRNNVIELLGNYYNNDELNSVIDILDKEINNFKYESGSDVLSYGYVPYKLIARYGSIDASILFELRDFYDAWMKKESENLGIDLFQGYKYWMQHHYAGYTLEKNGAYWNDEKADEINDWCMKGLINAQKN